MADAFRAFDVRVRSLQRLSPSFLRVTFTGEDLHEFADNGYDQRIKLILPLPGTGVSRFPRGADWFKQWYAQGEERNPLRTYTVRAVRPELSEVDIDVVLHDDAAGTPGPAARWIASAEPGSEAGLFGPDARFEGAHGGLEFHPPTGFATVLLAGDETAVPAIIGILERLPAHITGEALLEVPHESDAQPIVSASAVKVTWLARGHEEWGSRLVPAVEQAAARLLPSGTAGVEPEEVDVDAEILWEVPEEGDGPCYAWLAGEAAVIKRLRRHLVSERGMDRKAVAFMGYWRQGRAEDA
ncbi:siderophore-interacting protein [Nonomuraea sp. NPDC050310]|uniref:siderophore-interacting protein n=1 Tax=unclassified Nonomuraea TaxID=2593643 RepID=UPI003409D573